MAKFDIKNGVLKKIYTDADTERIIIPDTVTEIENTFSYYNSKGKYLYIPDSVECYRFECIKYTYFRELDLPWRKTLELAIDTHVRADLLKLRIDDYCIKFNLSDVNTYNSIGMVLKLLRTEEFRLRYPLVIKAPIAIYLATKYNHAVAIKYLKDNILNIIRYFINSSWESELDIILNIAKPKKITIDTLLKESIKQDNNELTIILTQYKHENFEEKQTEDRFKL